MGRVANSKIAHVADALEACFLVYSKRYSLFVADLLLDHGQSPQAVEVPPGLTRRWYCPGLARIA
jgi:hypothetical protein